MLKNILDIVVIGIVVIAFLVGFVKGFYKSIWGIVTLAIFIVALYFSTPPVTKMVINNTKLDDSIAKKIESPIGKLPGMNLEFEFTDEETVANELEQAGVSQSFIKNYVKLISKHAEPGDVITFKEVVAKEIAQSITEGIVAIGLSIVLGILLYSILFRQLKKLFDKMVKNVYLKPADKVLGVVFQVVIAAVILIFLGGLAGTMREAKFMKKVNETYPSTIAFKYIYGENPLQSLFDSKLNLGKFIK